jgi:hypothetical protein
MFQTGSRIRIKRRDARILRSLRTCLHRSVCSCKTKGETCRHEWPQFSMFEHSRHAVSADMVGKSQYSGKLLGSRGLCQINKAEGSVCWLPMKKRPEHTASGLFMMARRQQKNLSWPGPQGARSQRTRPHAKARSNWRRYRLQGTSATGAEFQPSVGTGKIRPQPVPPRGTFLIDALHGPARQVLHRASPSSRNARICLRRATEAVNTAGL